MDYEKKYKQALEKAKKELDTCGSQDCDAARQIFRLFPELSESEDEKIRKALIEYFNEQCDMSDWNGVYGYQVVAWLEKQVEKPQKTSIWKHWKDGIAGNGEGTPVYLIKDGYTYSISSCLCFECDYIELSELDKLLYEKQGGKKTNPVLDIEIPFGAKDSELQEATYHIPKGFHAKIDDDKVVIKQGEQKPYGQRKECLDCQFNYAGECKGYCAMKRSEQKPAWSEEDEKRIFRIKLSLQKDMMAHKNSGCDIADLQDCEDWLMNLYESHRVQPKQEWSEEDEKMIEAALQFAHEYGRYGLWCWLKSLKERYTWKPSDEQIEALKDAKKGVFRLGILESLYNDLEKLKQ